MNSSARSYFIICFLTLPLVSLGIFENKMYPLLLFIFGVLYTLAEIKLKAKLRLEILEQLKENQYLWFVMSSFISLVLFKFKPFQTMGYKEAVIVTMLAFYALSTLIILLYYLGSKKELKHNKQV